MRLSQATDCRQDGSEMDQAGRATIFNPTIAGIEEADAFWLSVQIRVMKPLCLMRIHGAGGR